MVKAAAGAIIVYMRVLGVKHHMIGPGLGVRHTRGFIFPLGPISGVFHLSLNRYGFFGVWRIHS
jgi:hypothetical protein